MSGVAAAVCLLVAVLFERRRRGRNVPKTSFYESPTYTATTPPAPPAPPVHAWPPAGPIDEPVWEDVSAPPTSDWPVEVSEPEAEVSEPEAEVEVAESEVEVAEPEADVAEAEVEPEVEAFQPEVEVAEPELHSFESPVSDEVVEHEAEVSAHEPEPHNEPESVVEVPQQPAFARDNWFGTFAPPTPRSPPSRSTLTASATRRPTPTSTTRSPRPSRPSATRSSSCPLKAISPTPAPASGGCRPRAFGVSWGPAQPSS